MNGFWGKFNLIEECRKLRWGIWQCPPFLFLLMGTIIIFSMVATHVLASRYTDEPEMAALVVMAVTTVLFVIGNAIISGFNRVAEANRMKSEFISIVSHQLRSPLSIFKWTLEVLERENENDKNVSHFRTLDETVQRMLRLVNTLLEASRLEAKTISIKPENFDIKEFTRKILDSFVKYAEACNIKFIIDDGEGPCPVFTDKEHLGMVLQNLIDNAVRYTSGSGTIRIAVGKEGENLRWSITDQGMGIPVSQQKYIFHKFFRALNAYTTQPSGSGVGLYISKGMTEAMGGKIGFSSVEGKSSTFWITLPVKNINKNVN